MTPDAFFGGRAAIVTGGGRGIGRAIALRLGSLGAAVHVVARTDNARIVAREIADGGGTATWHVGRVEDESFAKSVVAEAGRATGAVDIVVNAAAILGPHARFAEGAAETFAEVLQVNLLGACNFMRLGLPGMERAGFGRIVNFAGGGAAYSYPMFSPYAASKAALVRVTETVADEIRVPGVTVNIIAPGAVDTDMLAEVRRHGGEVRTVVEMHEPVDLVMFLAGPDSGHINGRFIHSRDDWSNPDLFASADLLKLRRVERR